MILQWISNFFTKRRQQAALRAFAAKWGYNLQESSYLTIGKAGIVSEFGYLIRYITEDLQGGAIDDFDDFERIANHIDYIEARISLELQSESPRETRLVSLETARANLRNLRLIVKCLAAYVEMARAAGLPLNPMKRS
jgi:hypothetical protein